MAGVSSVAISELLLFLKWETKRVRLINANKIGAARNFTTALAFNETVDVL